MINRVSCLHPALRGVAVCLNAVLAITLSGGCASTGDDLPTSAGLQSAARFQTDHKIEVVFGPCEGKVTGGSYGKVDCGTASVPVQWAAPDGPGLGVTVRRYRQPGAKIAVWLLQGGPGINGSAMASIGLKLRDEGLNADLFVPDHRGTGASTRLSCSVEKGKRASPYVGMTATDWAACISELESTWGAGLAGFSTHEAAADIGALIAATSGDYEAIRIVGVSYGTYLAHRYLTMFPQQPDAVVLDSLCISAGCDFATWDRDHDAIARDVLKRCAQDAFCRKKLGPDPVGTVTKLAAKMQTGHCKAAQSFGLDAAMTRRLFAAFLADSELVALLPLVAYKLDRCSKADVQALKPLEYILSQFPPDDLDPIFSNPQDAIALHRNIVLSELLRGPLLDPAEARAGLKGLIASPALTPGIYRLAAQWPRYDVDPRADLRATTSARMLLLQGDLDPRTTAADAVAFRPLIGGAGGPGLIVFPDVGHSVMTRALTKLNRSCALAAAARWLSDPGEELPGTCLDDLDRIDFQADATKMGAQLGLDDDPWKAAAPAVDPRTTAYGRALLERIARAWLKTRSPTP